MGFVSVEEGVGRKSLCSGGPCLACGFDSLWEPLTLGARVQPSPG
jgi:hypothetical protein